MQLIHTSDWHLGHHLHGLNRDYEHRRFLNWLLDTLEDRRADALLVSGDIFDSANPSAAAQTLYYQFLAESRRRLPDLDLVIVAGNHDSASRLDAPKPLLKAFNIHVIGSLGRTPSGNIDVDALLVPLTNQNRETAAWCAAVPFLRPADLPRAGKGDDWLVKGVREIYDEVFTALSQRRGPGQALVATGHAYLTGTQLSELSERKIQVGNQQAIPVDVFPEHAAYTALGHLHRAQRVGRRDHVRYSGSPLPLSLDEADYLHQVVAVTLNGEAAAKVESVPVPRAVDIIRLPKGKQDLTVEELLPLLHELPNRETTALARHEYPYLELSVFLNKPEPGLRKQLEDVLTDKAVRLLKIKTKYPKSRESLADSLPQQSLSQLSPADVFTRRYQSLFEGEPSKAMTTAFHELWDQAGTVP
ncbi:exonuclease SbcCD subunit D C-terminal domain-containing protein [Acanthopleuribacter pedis]|uniref:Nuclease SbcCD subunit D n=1 Tax=Acanthopleuribacter pedis TaxID=442870 RepID=A0A8J7U6K0_9BACT|nr:exonuclease SbcCD subunit D C-terminal domain-containing protein [Acanthopleuribacter pedis]MBO1321523.1 exonuclease SbcCD subunit D C-terminal domain-containing protein [Acanthopleuribacter pedis]